LCRLRDIQELFMGTGLGPESYALIEQGRIGQILSSRPTDRRAIIEEAAGITKFKTKKRLAEARLEDAKQNLARVNDIFEEVTRQMNSLKRQASKAERYARLRDEMRAKLRVVLASKFAQYDDQMRDLDAKIQAISDDIHRQSEALSGMETELAESRQRGYAIESEIRENNGRLNDIKLEVDRNQAQRRHNEERCNELTIRASASESELVQVRLRLSALEEELNANQQLLGPLPSGPLGLRLKAADLIEQRRKLVPRGPFAIPPRRQSRQLLGGPRERSLRRRRRLRGRFGFPEPLGGRVRELPSEEVQHRL